MICNYVEREGGTLRGESDDGGTTVDGATEQHDRMGIIAHMFNTIDFKLVDSFTNVVDLNGLNIIYTRCQRS